MKTIFKLSLSLLIPLLGACGCPNEHIGDILSPDKAHKAELRHCGCYSTVREITQVSILKSDETAACRSAFGIAGFNAPSDHAPLQVRWLSNDTVEAAYPGYPGFPDNAYESAQAEIKVVFVRDPEPVSGSRTP